MLLVLEGATTSKDLVANNNMVKKCSQRKFKKGDFVRSGRGDTWKVTNTACSMRDKPTVTIERFYKGTRVATISGVDEKRLKKHPELSKKDRIDFLEF